MLKINKNDTKSDYIFNTIILTADGELAYEILRLQRIYNPRRNLKLKANYVNRERLKIENNRCSLLCDYLKLCYVFKYLLFFLEEDLLY